MEPTEHRHNKHCKDTVSASQERGGKKIYFRSQTQEMEHEQKTNRPLNVHVLQAQRRKDIEIPDDAHLSLWEPVTDIRHLFQEKKSPTRPAGCLRIRAALLLLLLLQRTDLAVEPDPFPVGCWGCGTQREKTLRRLIRL